MRLQARAQSPITSLTIRNLSLVEIAGHTWWPVEECAKAFQCDNDGHAKKDELGPESMASRAGKRRRGV